MTNQTINIDHWPSSSFVTVNRKRPDTYFCQYTVGKLKPNYPMPAIRHEDMIVNWHGKRSLIVVYPNQEKYWRGYATVCFDYFK